MQHVSTNPSISKDDAKVILENYAEQPLADEEGCETELLILTMLNGDDPSKNFGNGYKHVLAWKICPIIDPESVEQLEGIVNAETGEVLKFSDTLDYFESKGSVYPISNNGLISSTGIPIGVQQEDW